jgi:hypothetical protein
MIIDAMDLLYTGRFSSFCLVSSDSDFTRLVSRIREQGVTVYGFGERKTPAPFVAACDQFMYFDALKIEEERQPSASQAANSPAARLNSGIPSLAPETSSTVVQTMPTRRPLDQAALTALTLAISSTADGDNWAFLSQVGTYLSRLSPNMQPRNYGYDRLRDFVEASGIVDLQLRTIGDRPPIAVARLRES